jgi:phosphoserine phosphatase
MQNETWQLRGPTSAIVFDCDGTLSTIEGVNELAKKNGVYQEIESLTEAAMGKTGINPALYQKRLSLIGPKEQQVEALGNQYFAHLVLDASKVIEILQRLGKSVYIVSAGLYPAVKIFGRLLQVPKEHIYAVDIHFDENGNYLHYEKTSPLITNNGKRIIVSGLKAKHEEIIHIGDGLNDYVTHDIVTRFIGYGGVYYRENIENLCEYYIKTQSLASLLPLVLTPHESLKLKDDEQKLYHEGLNAIKEGKVKMKNV